MLITDVVVDMNTVIARSTNAIVMNMIVIVEMSVIVNTNITNVNVKKKPQKSLVKKKNVIVDVVKVVLFYHCCGLGAFTCTWRAKEDVIFHVIGFVFCSVLFVKDVNVFEVASELVVVKSEAYDEVIGDLHGRIVDLDVFLV